MSAMHNQRNPHTVVIPLGALAGAATSNLPGFKAPKNFIVESVQLVDSVAISASNSNYVTITLKDHTNTLSLATYDSRAANQGALAALEGGECALVAGTDAAEVKPTTLLARGATCSVTSVSTGTAVLTAAVLVVQGYYL